MAVTGTIPSTAENKMTSRGGLAGQTRSGATGEMIHYRAVAVPIRFLVMLETINYPAAMRMTIYTRATAPIMSMAGMVMITCNIISLKTL